MNRNQSLQIRCYDTQRDIWIITNLNHLDIYIIRTASRMGPKLAQWASFRSHIGIYFYRMIALNRRTTRWKLSCWPTHRKCPIPCPSWRRSTYVGSTRPQHGDVRVAPKKAYIYVLLPGWLYAIDGPVYSGVVRLSGFGHFSTQRSVACHLGVGGARKARPEDGQPKVPMCCYRRLDV